MIRVGLIGFGMAGRVFHAPVISSVPGLELAAVLERSTNLAAERYPRIQVHRSLESMLADSSLGLFVVATPNATHITLAKQILGAGKSVVVDKPMTLTSAEAAELIALARQQKLLLAPFHNRRWDSDFQTIQKLLLEEPIGRLVAFDSRLDRWRPAPLKVRLWKEDTEAGGGTLHDLGPHLVDQALVLFGKPEAVSADLRREKDGSGVNDSFTLRLRYPGLIVTLGANSLSLHPGPRFLLRGTKGSYLKTGVDPQEAALNKLTHIDDPAWGREPESEWGKLYTEVDGAMICRPVPALPGDYRLYYAGIRDALLGISPPPVTGLDGWRVARILEWAAESSAQRREIPCDWSGEP